VCFSQSDRAGTAHIQGTHGLRDSPFYPSTLVIAGFELGCLLSSPCCLKSLVRLIGMEREFAWSFGTACTLGTDRTRQAVGFGKLDLNSWIVTRPMFWLPVATDLSLGTGHLLRLPINEEVIQAKRSLLLRLPTLIGMHWADQFNAIVPLTGLASKSPEP
jgi:hypothetical protein